MKVERRKCPGRRKSDNFANSGLPLPLAPEQEKIVSEMNIKNFAHYEYKPNRVRNILKFLFKI